jgi:two-component sensor histidine kinase
MIAEDDLLTADMLKEVLVESGYDVCGIARTVDKAVELGERHKPDLAVLDIRLAEGGLGTDIPARLKNPGHMGVLYASGHVGRTGLTKADGEALLTKPYRREDVVRALQIVEQIVSTDAASRLFPRGFAVLDASYQGAQPDDAEAEVRQQNSRLRRQQAQLARFGTFALAERDLGNVLSEACRVCAQCLEVTYCTVYRYRSEENDLIVEAGIGWNHGVIGRFAARAQDSSPQGRAFVSRGPVACGDLSANPTFVRSSLYSEHGINSTINVVIGNDYQPSRWPYGVLAIDSTALHDYDPYDIDFLTGIANILAASFDAAKRNAALQIAADRVRVMVDDRKQFLATESARLDSKNRLLDEKTEIAREMQHRIRNDFQLVYGMLSDQLLAGTDTDATRGVRAIARRVMTLAQVYDHLLGAELSGTVDFNSYLESLCAGFAALENAEHPEVKLTCHGEPVILDLDTATALGLAVSELIANSYAHAFPDDTGSIGVSLSLNTGGSATIVFSDDGMGFVDPGDSSRYGLPLVKRLIEQVGGSATLRSDHGTEWTLKFPVPAISSPGASSAGT